MNGWKALLLLAAMVAQIVADRMPPSVFATVLRDTGLGYVVLTLVLTARAGYRRRLPYWTRDSWRRYWRSCAAPAAALLLCLGMTAAQDYHLLVIGAPKSILRGAWIAVLLSIMGVGVWKLSNAISWLTDGDPAQQF